MFVKFQFWGGKYMVVPYTDLIHIRKDFNEHDFFGDSGRTALTNIMTVLDATDKGIVNAIKNSAVIKWLLKFNSVMRKEDKEREIKDFREAYLNVSNSGGVAASDAKFEAEQVKEQMFVPNTLQNTNTLQRIYSYFGVNDAIVQGKYTEDEWISFFEAEIEPIIIQLSNGFTNGIFTERERGFGNKIIFEASNLAYASMRTKLQLVQMVDRGALTPNEWRAVMNLTPIEGGDEPIRRLDTAVVDAKDDDERKEEEDDKKE
jgi:HK97 family phage portal protein